MAPFVARNPHSWSQSRWIFSNVAVRSNIRKLKTELQLAQDGKQNQTKAMPTSQGQSLKEAKTVPRTRNKLRWSKAMGAKTSKSVSFRFWRKNLPWQRYFHSSLLTFHLSDTTFTPFRGLEPKPLPKTLIFLHFNLTQAFPHCSNPFLFATACSILLFRTFFCDW